MTPAVLRALAALAPDRRRPQVDIAPSAVAWLGTLDTLPPGTDPWRGGAGAVVVPSHTTLVDLARDDALAPGIDRLRVGWMWALGDAGADGVDGVDGVDRTLCAPMLSAPVRLDADQGRVTIAATGPWDLWPLVDDETVASDLEDAAVFDPDALVTELADAAGDAVSAPAAGAVRAVERWATDVLTASGLPAATFATAWPGRSEVPRDRLTAIVGYGVYVAEPLDLGRPRQSLTTWSTAPGTDDSAFAAIYDDGATGAPDVGDVDVDGIDAARVQSPLPLSERQRQIVVASRTEPIVVVSGPPGTGKTQTAAAIALDAVAAGRSVLVATQSQVAAGVVADMLASVPGPQPVLFGGGERARELADRLADGVEQGERPRRDDTARATADALRQAILADLGDVAAAAEWERRRLAARPLADAAPLLLRSQPRAAGSSPVAAASELLAATTRHETGWWRRMRSRRALRRLRRLVGARPDIDVGVLAEAVAAAGMRERAQRAARRVRGEGDARLLASADAAAAADAAWARWLDTEARGRVGRGERRAVAALATALRAGHATRRRQLASLDVPDLLRALPLWIGTLNDIEELLPQTAGAFDLLILDEASQIDQIAAAAGLLRARRAVVIGDPRQLRFVSFVADREVAATLAREHLTQLAGRLDVRRVSAFDLAASVAPVVFLDEHFRSVPHLIGFSAQHFYDGRLRIATRRPDNEQALAIEVRRLDGDRSDGVNDSEVTAAVEEVVRTLAADDAPSVGVVSPYRAQADAIAEAVAAAVDLGTLQRGRVKVGTVHSFQGGECDVVIASFAIGGATDRGRRFLEDAHLFNVLVTRARRRLVALVSGELPSTGLLADYVRWAGQPPPIPVDQAGGDGWTRALADVLTDAGERVRVGYEVGRWTVDLVVGEARPVAVATRVHPDGPAAHLERYVALHRAGWHQTEAFAVSTEGDAVAAALALRPAREL